MKILVLGAEGMLGHIVKHYFQENGHSVRGTSRSGGEYYKFDVTDNIKDIEHFIGEFNPDTVINCIGILNKVAEENKTLAVMVNSYFPHYLAEACNRLNTKLVHISTDCVFDGKKGEYTEDSFKDATSFYGQSKALGEVKDGHNLTLRTSIVGPDTKENGIGLFQWFMNQQVETNGFDKVIWTGVTTIELAKAIEKSIINNLSGLRHVVNNQKINKYDLLNLFKKHFHKNIVINKKSEYVSDKSLIRTTDFDFEVPSYDQMVKEMADWVTKNQLIYSVNQRVAK